MEASMNNVSASGPTANPIWTSSDYKVVQVCFPNVRASVLDSLNQQRVEGRLCDLSIQVQGQVFRAHRCVLAASSPYFHDQVLLKNVTTVSLPSVMDPVAFESVLSSAYTGQLTIMRDDIVNYVTVASFLQMWHIVDKCTEILKRQRPPAECNMGGDASSAAAAATHHGVSSRQQSPSSSDCLYMEREGIKKEKRPDALPPLATWRRPQQFPRWGRVRRSPAQHLAADSQLDTIPGPGGESDYSSCEEVWMSSSKVSPFSHDGRGGGGGGQEHISHTTARHHGGFSASAEGLRLRARLRMRGGPSERPHGRGRGEAHSGGFGEEPQEKMASERGIEADEGMGEEVVEVEKNLGSERTGHPGDFHVTVHQDGEGRGPVSEGIPDESERKDKREPPHREPEEVIPGPSSLASSASRTHWQTSPWSQQEGRPQDGQEEGGGEGEEEAEVDFGRFADGAFGGGDTYDEIEDGTGQVSQRPLVPASPDNSEFTLNAPPELTWSSAANMSQAAAPPIPTSVRHPSPTSATFPPSSSPPTPTSSSSLSLAGAPYTGKVHFCHCGKAYTLKSMRDRHVKMQHLNLRPFGCLVCAKTFKMKHHLTKHLKTHGGLRPYECRLCGKKVIWRDSFLRHQARCERLAASYGGAPTAEDGGTAAVADMDSSYGGYGFDEGEGFLSEVGQVKVEQADFQEEVMSGILGRVAKTGDVLGDQSRALVNDGFKEEVRDRFS